jgi:AraC-like DNA-binding protein
MKPLPPARHLLRAKDLVDARYREPLDVRALARAAHLSPAHFSREFGARSANRRTSTS